jgi:predicted flap endonuclease-1-like 5' DNA nuclease/cell division protein FtsB
MRGTTYAVSEIIWWMAAALAIGLLIGWVLRRWFDGGTRLKDVQAELDAKNARYAQLSTELGESKLQVESLNRDLEARAGELTGATGRVDELEARAGELESQIGAIGEEKEVGATRLESSVAAVAGLESTVAERDARLIELESTVASLQAELKTASIDLVEARTAHAECTVSAEAGSGRIAGLETGIAERDERIAELEARFAVPTDLPAVAELELAGAMSADLEGLAAAEEVDEGHLSAPLTRFGTAGADHTDDLKVINGIGPKMEELLNGFGIRAWDQLAALTAAEVARVDEALEEFPGRIERDEWVAQAIDLVRRFPDPRERPDRETYLNESPS